MKIKRCVSVICLAAAFVLMLPPVASAQRGADKKAQAEVHYDQGKAYYRAGAHDLAIKEFLAGYELDPRAGVLFNVGRAYEELKNPPKAIEFYQKYLDLGDAATAAVEARARIVVLERMIKQEKQARQDAERRKVEEAAAAAEQAEREKQAALAAAQAPRDPDESNQSSNTSTDAMVTASETPPDPARARMLKLGGMIAGGTGLVLSVTGIVFLSQAGGLEDDINAEVGMTQTWTQALTDKNEDVGSKKTLGAVTLIIGGAAIVGGAVAYYLGWSQDKAALGQDTASLLLPTIGPDGSPGVAWAGRF